MSAGVLGSRLDSLIGGPSARALKAHLQMETAEDLVRHYPRRYFQRGDLTDLSKLVVGEHVTVMARVVDVKVHEYRDPRPGSSKRLLKRTEVVVTDGTGTLLLTFFRQPHLTKVLHEDVVGLFAGKVGAFRGRRQLLHPDYELLDSASDAETDRVSRFQRTLIPIYPATAKVASWKIARCVRPVLDALGDVPDPVPRAVLDSRGLISLPAAFDKIHRPADFADVDAARRRLRFEEAFILQTALALRRGEVAQLPALPRPGRPDGLLQRFETRLPFQLTRGQLDVGEQISADLSQPHPMYRLLQGEVGSGKTVIALRAMLQVVDAGGQAVLLAPTEVLAQQHHRSIGLLLGDLGYGGMLGGAEDATRVRLLTGSMAGKARREALLDAASGVAGIVVGTHALLEERVQFADLGLVVVDEQHRFGVEQRAALTAKAGEARPHVLVMTATPIPRTVAMTVFGDLDTSTLRELPSGRQPTQTTVVPELERPDWLERTWTRIVEEVAEGHQAYVVCSRIGDDGDEPALLADDPFLPRRTHAATDLHELLATGPLASLRSALLHGRLTPDVKDQVMTDFSAGLLDVLVATTVIEVGVDVPDASVMVVMDAERFGVSQLHQLRGRVGRGGAPGLCLLVTSTEAGSSARRRLDAVAATTDGFELSELDLRLRREGDVLGASQSGRSSSLRLLSVIEHEEVIADARNAAELTVAADPRLGDQPALADVIRELEETERADYLEKA